MAEFGSNELIVLNSEQIAQVEALAGYLSVDQVADYLQIGKATFYKIMERQPEVGERYRAAKANMVGDVAKSLIMQAREGSVPAATFYLKTQAGWKETNVTEHAGSVEINEIKRTIVDPLLSK